MTQFSTFQFSEPHARQVRQLAESCPPEQLADSVRQFTNGNSMGFTQLLAQNEFAECGQPYCKVFPRMARSLAGINLATIPVADFAMPFPAFEIRLPRPEWPGSLLVYQIRDPDVPSNLCFILQRQIERNPLKTTVFTGVLVGYENLQQAINEGVKVSLGEHSLAEGIVCLDDVVPDLVLVRQCWSLAISVALFISDKHELVCPDLEPRLIHRQGKSLGKRGMDFPPAAALSLGREIELPRVEYEALDLHGDGTGRGLSNSHWRCAHYRQQPCGPDRSERKRIYIGPTIVRPDLPPDERAHGFKITDRQK